MFSIFSIGATKEFVVVAMSILLFSLPGLPIYKATFRRNIRHNPEAVFIGAAIGISVSCFVAVMVGYYIKWDIYTIAGSLLILWGILHLLQKKLISSYEVQIPWSKNDYTILLVFLSVVLFSIAYPFLNVGRLTNDGFAYAHLFGHDFILRVSFAASIAHGIPPVYLNFADTILPTYWLFYVFPAFVYLFLGPSSSLQNILLLTQIFSTLVFVAILFSVLRVILKSKLSIIVSLLIGLCAYSYYDIIVLLQSIAQRLPDNVLAVINRYGLTEYSGVSHSIFRVFLYEPQAILVLSFILIIILLLYKEASEISEHISYSVIGFLMALSFGTDAFIGIIIVIWCTTALSVNLITKKSISFRNAVPIIESIVVFSLTFLSFYLIQMYTMSSSNSGLMFKPYKMIFATLPAYLVLEFGPAVIFGVLGIIVFKKLSERSKYIPIILLACISLFISLTVRHSFEMNLGLRKGAYVLYIPLIIFSGIYFDYLFSLPRLSKKVMFLAAALLVLAVPTLFTDISAVSDIGDRKKTTYVSVADFNACKWIKQNTPENVVVQSEPEYPSPYEFSLISNFAERAMVISESKRALFVRIPNIKQIAEERKQEIRRMFGGAEIGPALETINKYGINYVYLGHYEQMLYSNGVDKFEKNPRYFEKVYSVNGVRIYKTTLNK
jgi:hypothetical protein